MRGRKGRATGPTTEGTLRVVDTEKTELSTSGKVIGIGFPFATARLGKFAKMYERVKINRVIIKCVGMAGSAEAGTLHYGILSGNVDKNIQNVDQILAMRPNRSQHISHTTSLIVTHDIQLGKWSPCDDDDSFSLYSYTDVANKAYFEISYDLIFASPRPF